MQYFSSSSILQMTNSIICLWLKLWDSVHFRKYCYLMDMLSLAWQCCKRNLMKCILGFSQRWLFSMLPFLHSAFSPRCLFSTVAFLHGVVNGKNSYEVHPCLFSTVTHVRISAVGHRVLPELRSQFCSKFNIRKNPSGLFAQFHIKQTLLSDVHKNSSCSSFTARYKANCTI